ncbi:taste receptor type 2 member 39-like [Pelodytes ibericus]
MPMLSPYVTLTLHTLFLLTGLSGNIFILRVHFLDWLKTHDTNPCDLIINTIGFSNIFLQGTVVANEFCFNLFLKFYAQDWIIKSFIVIMGSLAFSSLWSCTCLCFYYCIKIINLKGEFFYRLKAKIPKMVPWLLTGSIVTSWAAGLPSYWDIYITSNVSDNSTSTYFLILNSRCNCIFWVYTLLSSFAFIIISNSAIAIVISLCKHMRKMTSNHEGHGRGKITSHLTAAKTVISLLIIYLTFYGALNLIFNEPSAAGTVYFSLCFVVVTSFPTINAIVLITGNRKLINAMKELLGIKSDGAVGEVTSQ